MAAKIGENALERVVRLLARLNERFADPDTTDMEYLDLVIRRDGGMTVQNVFTHPLFTAATPAEMVRFLESSPAVQVWNIRTEGRGK